MDRASGGRRSEVESDDRSNQALLCAMDPPQQPSRLHQPSSVGTGSTGTPLWQAHAPEGDRSHLSHKLSWLSPLATAVADNSCEPRVDAEGTSTHSSTTSATSRSFEGTNNCTPASSFEIQRPLGSRETIWPTESSTSSGLPVPSPTLSLISRTLSHRATILLLGHACAGKSSLIYRLKHGPSTLASRDDITQAPVSHSITMDKRFTEITGELVIWDTPGSVTPWELMQTPAVKQVLKHGVDCIVLCFSIGDPDTVPDIEDVYIPIIRDQRRLRHKPLILAGLKADLRDKLAHGNMMASVGKPGYLISNAEGERIKNRIGALAYFDCSAATGKGAEDLFHRAFCEGLDSKPKSSESRWQNAIKRLSNRF